MLQESLPQGQYIISPPGMNPAENPYDPSYNVRLQQLIVPAEDAQTYEKFIREKYPNLHIDMQHVSPEQAKANVDGGVALEIKTPLSQMVGNQQPQVQQPQVPPAVAPQVGEVIATSTNTSSLNQNIYNYKPNDPAVMKATMEQYNKDVAAGTVKDFSVPASQQSKGSEDKDGIIKTVEHTGTMQDLAYNKTGPGLGSLLPEIKINKEDVPGVIANVAKMVANYSTNKEENKMENTNNNAQAQVPATQTQAAAPATTENKAAEAAKDSISWKKVAKCTGLVLGGVGIGAAVFGGSRNSEPAPAEALKNAITAADTMAKADPKAIASAAKSIVSGFFASI